MVVDSYLEEFRKTYPMILPLTQDQVATIQRAINLKPKTKYVLKSQRVAEIEREQQMLAELRRKISKVDLLRTNNHFDISSAEFHLESGILPQADKFSKDGGNRIVKDKLEEHFKARKQQGAFVWRGKKDLVASIDNLQCELERLWQIEQKGTAGEDAVEQYLQKFLRCRFITNVILPSAEHGKDAPKTAETDMLIFSPRGIYVCEVKNYGKAGQTLKIGSDGSIGKFDYNGQYLEELGNPYLQNHLHCRAVEAALQRAGITDIPIFSVLVIANSDVRCENRSGYWAGDKYQLVSLINKTEEAPLFSNETLEMAFQAVQAVRMGERKFPVPTIEEEYQTLCQAVDILCGWNEAEQKWDKRVLYKILDWGSDMAKCWKAHNPKWVRYSLYRYYCNWSLFRAILFGAAMVISSPGVLWHGLLLGKPIWKFYGMFFFAAFLLSLCVYSYDKMKKRKIHTILYLAHRTLVVEPIVWLLYAALLYASYALYHVVG